MATASITPLAVASARGLERVRVLAEDPGLGEHLEPERFEEAAASSVAAVLRLPTGDWSACAPARTGGWLGLLVLEGMLARRVTVSETTWVELLGPGDLIEPWRHDRELYSSIPATVEFEVLRPARLAVLDGGFAKRMSAWPEVVTAASGRLVERVRSLTYTLAICGRVGVAERVLLTLRHLADRWGHVTAEGIVVHLPGVTHEVLASQVGAARPSVSTALGQLRERGDLVRLGDGSWLLRAPEEHGAALAA